MSIITYPLNGVTYSAEDAETYLCSRASGVFASTGNFEISSISGYKITIGTGLAWIKDGDFSGKSICNNEAVTLTLSTAASANSRYDRIVLRFDKANNVSTLKIIEGTAGTSPSAPAIVRNTAYYDLGLYLIYRGAGTTVVAASDITNTMTDEAVCGIMSDGVTGIPTSNIYAQWESLHAQGEALLEELKTDLKNLDVDVIPAASVTYDDTDSEIGADNAQTAIEALKGLIDGQETEIQTLHTNTAFKKLGTAKYNNTKTVSGTTTFTNADGFSDILLQFSLTNPINATFTLNSGTATKVLTNQYRVETVQKGYIHLRMYGQFCRAELIPTSMDYLDTTYPLYGELFASLPRLISVDSTCKLTSLTLGILANTTDYPSGSIIVWGR